MKKRSKSSLKDYDPIDRMVYWIREREAIRVKRERGIPRPWTDDPILLNYRFCNVRRMDDRVSKWLVSNFYIKRHPLIVVNTALARFLNLETTLEYIGFQHRWNTGNIIKKLRKYRGPKSDPKRTVFNSAYVVRGNDGDDKIESVVRYYCEPLTKNKLKIRDTMEETILSLKEYHGFGLFMAGQVVADLRWTTLKGDRFTDRMTWAPKGPGSERGINRIKERDVGTRISQEQFTEELNELISDLSPRLPLIIKSRIEAHDYQNCLCEFDKFERILWEQGQMRKKFQGHEEQGELFDD